MIYIYTRVCGDIYYAVVTWTRKGEVSKSERSKLLYNDIVHETVSYDTRFSAHGCFILSSAIIVLSFYDYTDH